MHGAENIVAERVSFTNVGETLVGTLYRPAGQEGRLPGILVAGSWTTVKEQMAGLYARKLAQHGFAGFAFDFRGWGESGGEPRAFESPRKKIADVHAAAEQLRGMAHVDPERTGALAVCASAGYVAHAVAGGAPLRSVVLVAGWLHDPESVKSFYGGDQGVARRVSAGRNAAEHYRSSGNVEYVPAYDPSNPDAGMFFELDYYANPERGRVPSWDNRLAVMSWPEWLQFDALSAASRVRVPTLMIHADGAALPDNARRFFAELAGPKELHWTEGTQTDFYDLPSHVDPAVQLAAEHFGRTLHGKPEPG
jgi:hypothetical protein